MIMIYRVSFCFAIFASLLFTSFGKDPELQRCKDHCRSREELDAKKIESCVKECDDYVRWKREREQHRRGGGGASEEFWKRETGQGGGTEEDQNPYVYEDRHFITGVRTPHGRIRILQKFTHRSPELLRGIENYRVVILEADPQTFIVPNHNDAESVVFVSKGKGTLSLIEEEKRESFNIKEGDVLRMKAGITAYLINRDNNQKLVLVRLLRPVSTVPGEFQTFIGAGGENPEYSYYSVFSNEILEAAFNTRRERLEKLFGTQRQGVIVKASEEQIKALSHHEEGGIWPFGGGESKGTFNIYEHRPTHSNQYGELYEVDSSRLRPLQDMDISVSFANITRGGMTALYYNSKATKITVVVDGNGYFEMACPHLSPDGGSREEHEHHGESLGGRGYRKISSPLKRGTVVVTPAGHPTVAVASDNENLQLICFEIHAYDNKKFPLTGKRNVVSRLEKEAMELAFGLPAEEVEEIFKSQQEEFFFRGPRRDGGRYYY